MGTWEAREVHEHVHCAVIGAVIPQKGCFWEISLPPCIVETPASLKEFLGREIAITPWFGVTQDRIRQFAEVTEDCQWIHVDQERARVESPYGATIAHGFLTLSLVSHFVKQAVEIRSGVRLAVNYGLNRVRFPTAVRADSNIRARVALLSLKELPNAVEAIYSVSIETEGAGKPCCVAESIVRYYP
jgi:acyl dehydratase